MISYNASRTVMLWYNYTDGVDEHLWFSPVMQWKMHANSQRFLWSDLFWISFLPGLSLDQWLRLFSPRTVLTQLQKLKNQIHKSVICKILFSSIPETYSVVFRSQISLWCIIRNPSVGAWRDQLQNDSNKGEQTTTLCSPVCNCSFWTVKVSAVLLGFLDSSPGYN